MKKNIWINAAFQIGALVLALVIMTLILAATGAPPFKAYASILRGAFGSSNNLEAILISWSPLLLTTAGVLITFSAGLWNIGVEGQMTLGAIFATWMLRLLQDTQLPPVLIISLGILAGILGGALWAGLTGALKTFGGVNEIFGGLGLNFVATALTIYLVFGPWKRPGTGSMSGTQPFGRELWLPTLPGSELSPWALGLSILAIVAVYFLLRGTYFGLRLKAVGKNMKAAFLMGVPTWQYSMFAFLLCGALAGMAGAIQVTSVYHRLLPNISNGYGFLGLLVAMLVNYQALWAAPVAFFFASLNIGSIQLQLVYKLDASFSGVFQGLLVLLVLLGEGARQRLLGKAREAEPLPTEPLPAAAPGPAEPTGSKIALSERKIDLLQGRRAKLLRAGVILLVIYVVALVLFFAGLGRLFDSPMALIGLIGMVILLPVALFWRKKWNQINARGHDKPRTRNRQVK